MADSTGSKSEDISQQLVNGFENMDKADVKAALSSATHLLASVELSLAFNLQSSLRPLARQMIAHLLLLTPGNLPDSLTDMPCEGSS